MRFQDPQDCVCETCGETNSVSVKELLQLVASCRECGASFRTSGLEMIDFCDRVFTSQSAASILIKLEDLLGHQFTEDEFTSIVHQKDLTILHIVESIRRIARTDAAQDASSTEVVLTAIKSVFPSGPDTPDLDVPLLKAVEASKDYAASYL